MIWDHLSEYVGSKNGAKCLRTLGPRRTSINPKFIAIEKKGQVRVHVNRIQQLWGCSTKFLVFELRVKT